MVETQKSGRQYLKQAKAKPEKTRAKTKEVELNKKTLKTLKRTKTMEETKKEGKRIAATIKSPKRASPKRAGKKI